MPCVLLIRGLGLKIHGCPLVLHRNPQVMLSKSVGASHSCDPFLTQDLCNSCLWFVFFWINEANCYDSRLNKNWPKMHHCVLLKVSIVFPSFHPSLFARSPKVSLTFIPQIGIGKRQIVSERRVLLPPLLEKIVKGKKSLQTTITYRS